MTTTNITYLKNYQPSAFLIDHVDLNFDIFSEQTYVTAKLNLRRNPKITTKTPELQLDGFELSLQKIMLNDQLLGENQYSQTTENLVIHNVPDCFVLTTVVTINPKTNTQLTGLYQTGKHYCTHNEPDGFHHITFFIDRPDILTTFTTTITADQDQFPVLLANGNLIASSQQSDHRHTVTWDDPLPKSAYLFALIAGNFAFLEDYFTTCSGKKVTLKIYTDQQYLNQCHYAMQALKQAMRWDEVTFGREYDLNDYSIVAINDLNSAAMENKGLNVFNSDYVLASAKMATDADHERIASVVAHEYFHNWTGNRITCRDWFQIGFKEGLTTFRDQLFSEDTFSKSITRIAEVNFIRNRQFSEDAGPLAHPVLLKSYIKVDNFYTTTVYYKSAEIARMLQTICGKKLFRKIMDRFFNEFDGKAVTFDDFIQNAATVSGIDLAQFKLWYDQAGTPTLTIKSEYLADEQSYTLTITQSNSQPNAHTLLIPIAIGLLDEHGHDLPLQMTNEPLNQSATTRIIPIKNVTETIKFVNIKAKPVPSLLRNFSAPVKIKYDYSEPELIFLMLHDSDDVNRWDASQKLISTLILKLCIDYRNQKNLLIPTSITDTFQNILNNLTIETALVAKILQLPTENYLCELQEIADVEAIHHVIEVVKFQIATQLKPDLLNCYHRHNHHHDYTTDTNSIGNRSLKNLCLNYLMYLDEPEITKLALDQFNQSNNLTDTFGSLEPLANSNFPNRYQLLDEFYQQWKDNHVIVDKWLALNARIKHPDIQQRLIKLTQSGAFNIKNPNNIYSLIRTFGRENLVNFHNSDGSGYQFIADQIITIDRFNPHLAAHLATLLTNGNKFDPLRQSLIKLQLERILSQPTISKNTREIAAKGLTIT